MGYLWNLSFGKDENKISLQPIIFYLVNCSLIVGCSLIFFSTACADETPNKIVNGTMITKKIKLKSVQIYKKGASVFTFVTTCTEVIKRTIKSTEKSGNFLRDFITISLAILCGVCIMLTNQALNKND